LIPKTARVADAKVTYILPTERGLLIKDEHVMPFVQLFKVHAVMHKRGEMDCM